MTSSILKLLATALATTALLAGCGGHGNDVVASSNGTSSSGDTPATPVALPNTVISSVFDGQLDATQAATTFLLSDGSYFIVYADAAPQQSIKGAIVGDGTLANGSFSSTDGLDIGLLGSGPNTASAVTLSGSYMEKRSLNGSLTYTSNSQIRTFTGSYNNSYETLPSLSSLAGVYTGSIATKDQVESQIQLTVATDGTVSGTLPCGCSIEAKLYPRSDGTAYDATLAFTGGTHPFSGQSFAGNVYFDAASKRLYIVGKLSGTTDNAVFVGTKP